MYAAFGKIALDVVVVQHYLFIFVCGRGKGGAGFAQLVTALFAEAIKSAGTVIWNGPIMQILMNGCIIALLWLGGGQIIGGTMQLGALSSFIQYVLQILMSLMMLSMFFVMIIMNRAPLRRTGEILAEEPELKNPAAPVMEVADGSIDFENVSFRYAKSAKRNALEDISKKSFVTFRVNCSEGTREVEPLEEAIDRLTEEIRLRHIQRLQDGACTIQLGFVLNDLLSNLERISDHCSNIAIAVIEHANVISARVKEEEIGLPLHYPLLTHDLLSTTKQLHHIAWERVLHGKVKGAVLVK